MNETSSPPTRRRNARGDGVRLREEILMAASSLLQAGPAERITLRAIAREAGITAPSIYRHFDSVDAILRAVVEATFVDLEIALRTAITKSRSGSQCVCQVASAYLAFADERPEQYRLLFGGAWNAAALDPAQDVERQSRAAIGQDALQVLVDAIAASAEEGTSSSTDHFADAVGLWVGLHGLASLRRTTPLFPWPSGTEKDLVNSLARLTAG